MSNNEFGVMKLLVSIAFVLSGFFVGLGTTVTIVSWLWVVVALLFLGVTFGLLSYGSYLRGVGKIAKESDLDSNLSYRIDQIVRLKDGNTLLFLGESMDYDTQVVVEPRREGFKKFEVLNDEHHSCLVPKRLKAKIVDGRVWTPVK